VRAVPDGAVLTLESSMLNVLPVNLMAIAMGLHVRCGIEDNLWTQDRSRKMSSGEQVEQLVRISRELGREIASGAEAAPIYRLGEFYSSADETLARTASRRTARRARARAEARRLRRRDAHRPLRAGPARPRRRSLADAPAGARREVRVRSALGKENLSSTPGSRRSTHYCAIEGPSCSSRTAPAA
jgi:hypothetical protein